MAVRAFTTSAAVVLLLAVTTPAAIGATADLSLTKSDSPDPVLTSETLTYTLAVANAGPDNAQSVEVVDTLPADVVFVSALGASWDCSESGGVVTCTRYAVANGASSEIYITVTAPATGASLSNTATVTSTTADPDAGNNDVSYTLAVDNAGPNDATGVVVVDGFPAGKLSYQSDVPSQGSYDSGTGEWTVGPLGALGSAMLDIVFQVLVVTKSDPITNVAEVTASDQFDPDSTPGNSGVSPDEDDTDSTTVHSKAKLTDLGVVKTDSADPIAPGAPLTYTITVTNHGPDKTDSKKLHEVVAEDELPPGAVFLNTTGTDSSFTCVYVAVDHKVVCRRTENLDADDPKDIVVNVTGSPSPGTMTNTALVWVDNTNPAKDPALDTNPANDVAIEETTVTALVTDLSVVKVADVAEASVGQDITYTITLANLGPNDGSGIEVTDLMPAGVVYASDTPSQGTYDDAMGVWDVGAVVNGEGATLDIVATVQQGTSGTTITNTATITAAEQTDSNSGNDSDDALVDIVALPDIRVEKILQTISDPVNGATNPKAIPAATVEYTITVTNEGTGLTDSDTVIITDAVPAGTAVFVGDLGAPGSGPVLFEDGTPVSGLTYNFIDFASALDDVDFSNNGGVTYTYEPSPDADGFDPDVTHFRVAPGGAFAGSGGGGDPSFSLKLRVRVE